MEVMNINYNRVIKDMENENNYKIRYKLVKFALEFGKKQAAREFKTTVQTVRRWVNRYNQEGLKGLDNQSRKPHYSPNKCPDSFEKKVIKLRLQTKNTFGAKRLIERFDFIVFRWVCAAHY